MGQACLFVSSSEIELTSKNGNDLTFIWSEWTSLVMGYGWGTKLVEQLFLVVF